MGLKDLHRWDVTYREAVAIPEDLRKKLILLNAGITDPARRYLTTGKDAEAVKLLLQNVEQIVFLLQCNLSGSRRFHL
jgi:hypothetical protein